jgi:hypothetical protein
VVLLVAWLAAEHLGAGRLRRGAGAGAVTTAAVAAVAAVLLFVPAWLAADRSLGFVDNELEVTGTVVLIGRWGVKNLAFFGPVVLVALVLSARNTLDCLRHWSDSTLVRFGVLGFAGTELLYLRFPWKPLHLLPALVCLALVLAPSVRRHWHVVLIAGGLLHGVVTVTVAVPDVPHRATTAELSPSIVAGVVVTDVRCRLDDRRRGPWPDVRIPEAQERAEVLFDCQAALWRAPAEESAAVAGAPTRCCRAEGAFDRLRRCSATSTSPCRSPVRVAAPP